MKRECFLSVEIISRASTLIIIIVVFREKLGNLEKVLFLPVNHFGGIEHGNMEAIWPRF